MHEPRSVVGRRAWLHGAQGRPARFVEPPSFAAKVGEKFAELWEVG